jgi:hypothetical protein
MSEVMVREDGLLVVDSALPAQTFSAVCHEVACGDYRWVHSQKWDRAWRVWDGNVLRGEGIYFDPQDRFQWKGITYPTQSCIDTLIDTVRRLSAEYTDIAGREAVDWCALFLSPWLYPVGSALSLHRDGDRYSGAFTFFAHAEWSAHWGGELLVSRKRKTGQPPIDGHPKSWMVAGPNDADGSDIATAISPAPNRLVLIGPDRPHRIARVDQNAGSRVRASIAGFFLRG